MRLRTILNEFSGSGPLGSGMINKLRSKLEYKSDYRLQLRQLSIKRSRPMKTLSAALVSMILFAPGGPVSPGTVGAQEKSSDGWTSMFDGKTFAGWKANQNPDQWTIVDGAIKTAPGQSHLFYEDGEFTDFEFEADVKTTPGSNSGIYFHTKWQATGWPKHGYESQVNQTHADPVKSGSLYGVVKLYDSPSKDDQWYKHRIVVKGKSIRIHVNGKLVIDYTEPGGVDEARRLSKGTFALQSHDPKSVVYFRNLRIRPLAK